MNKRQVMSLYVSVKKITKKHCGACGGKRVFAIHEVNMDGTVKRWVRVSCSCGYMDFKDFDR